MPIQEGLTAKELKNILNQCPDNAIIGLYINASRPKDELGYIYTRALSAYLNTDTNTLLIHN